MKLYLARHGQTDWNLEMRAQGRQDQPLNDTGRQQAYILRNKIAHLQFDACYSSPLKRAAETAQIATNKRLEIIYDDRLLERNFGDFEGKIIKSWSELVDGVNIDDITLDHIEGDVETVQSVLARTQDFIESLKVKHPSDAQILVVGHGGMSKAFDWLLGKHSDNASYGATHLENGEIKEYEVIL